jgi:sulfoxide reductase heme-binding subunit YedZ
MRFAKQLIFVNALVPLVIMLWDLYHRQVGANPLEYVTHTTGMLALVFLTLTIAVTPLRRITGINKLNSFRRMLGLFAFFYASLHLLTYVWFDRFFNLKSTINDIAKRPFIAVGLLAFVLMIPLAVTSTRKMVKRLGGKPWAQLHRLVYVSAAAAAIHYWLLVKSDTRLPLTFGFVIALLLGHRLFIKYYPPEIPTNRSTIIPKG